MHCSSKMWGIACSRAASLRSCFTVSTLRRLEYSVRFSFKSYTSAPLAQFLVYYLSYIFESPQLITLGTSDIYAQLVHVCHEDVVIGMGFPRYSNQTVEGLRFAKRRGAKIVTITDNKISPLYELADNCILTKSDMNSFVDSLVAPLSIINALIIMAGLARKDYLVENFSVMEQVWREKNVYAKHDFDFMHKDQQGGE